METTTTMTTTTSTEAPYTASSDSLRSEGSEPDLFDYRRLRNNTLLATWTAAPYEDSHSDDDDDEDNDDDATTLRYVRTPSPSEEPEVLVSQVQPSTEEQPDVEPPPAKRLRVETLPDDHMQIFVRMLSGTSVKLWLEGGDTVSTAMAMISAMTRIPVDQQRLNFAGKQLEHSRTLASYGLTEGNQLNLVVGIRGGAAGADAHDDGDGDDGFPMIGDADEELHGEPFAEPPAEVGHEAPQPLPKRARGAEPEVGGIFSQPDFVFL